MAKVSPTGVDVDALAKLIAEMGERLPLMQILTVSEFLGDRYESGEINYLTYALTDLMHLFMSYQQGVFDLDEFNDIRGRLGDECVFVPVAFIAALADAWLKYLTAGEGVTLGEVFEIEGHGQGRRPMRETVRRDLRDFQIAALVNEVRLVRENAGKPISFEKAYSLVAKHLEQQGQPLSADTVKAAYSKNRPFLRRQRRQNGLGA